MFCLRKREILALEEKEKEKAHDRKGKKKKGRVISLRS